MEGSSYNPRGAMVTPRIPPTGSRDSCEVNRHPDFLHPTFAFVCHLRLMDSSHSRGLNLQNISHHRKAVQTLHRDLQDSVLGIKHNHYVLSITLN